MTDPVPLLPLLAQNAAVAGRVVFWCGILLLLAGVMVLVAFWIRRRMMSEDDTEPLPMGFSLSDLKTLHEKGELSDEEFEHAKRRMVAGTRSRLEVETEVAPPDAPEDSPQAAGGAVEPDDGVIKWEDPPEDESPSADLPDDPALDSDPDLSR